MENEQIVIQINAGIDTAENMLLLYNRMKGLIYAMAKHYSGLAELEDLFQEGCLALYEAVGHYDPAAKVKFSGYAGTAIKRRMLRYIRGNHDVGIPEYMQALISQYMQLCTSFQMNYGRKPSERETRRYLGLSREQAVQVEKAAGIGKIERLDSPIGSGDGEMTLDETLAGEKDLEGDILEDMYQEQLKEALWGAVDSLPGEQPEILKKRYREDMTLKEAGKRLGMKVGKVRSEEYKALRGLRIGHRQELIHFLPEYLEAKAYAGNGVAVFNRTWTSSTERVALMLESP